MKKLVLALCAMGAATLATPAMAAEPMTCGTISSPVDFTITGVPGGGGPLACVGYYDGNLLNSSNETAQRDAIAALLQTGPGTASGIATPSSINWNAMVAAGNTWATMTATDGVFSFGRTLYGQTILGFHFGNSLPDPLDPYKSASAFYLFDFGTTGATGLRFSPNANGLSNGAVYATGAVPEPATWAMMLLGFGAIGMASRRSRKPVLAQIA